MASLKTYFIMLKLLLSGYRENNQKEELYMLDALRKAESEDDFKNICTVLGKSCGLFCVPTLMAFAKEKNVNKANVAVDTLIQIRERVIELDSPDMKDFFSPTFWQPRWIGTKERFISYVACIAGIFDKEDPFDGVNLDETAEKLMCEIQVDLYPHETFQELRLCSPGWEAQEDFVNLLTEIESDTLIQNMFLDLTIKKSPEALYEENIVNMRCDYLLTRLNLHVDYQTLHYLLKVADQLNRPPKKAE